VHIKDDKARKTQNINKIIREIEDNNYITEKLKRTEKALKKTCITSD
jgi:hypothetical protein